MNQRDVSYRAGSGEGKEEERKNEKSASSQTERKKSFKEKKRGALMCEKRSLSHSMSYSYSGTQCLSLSCL